MGTTWHVELFAAPGRRDEELRRLIEKELARLVAQLSHWRADSDVSRFSHSPAGQWVDLPAELFYILESGLAVSEATGGAFDPAIGDLVEAWGFGPSQVRGTPPARRVDTIRLNSTLSRAWQPGGITLDLSAIAKGFAVDRLCQLLDGPDISSCLVEIGGELRGRGVKPNGQPWWVAIERPPDESASRFPEVRIALCGMSIASSGDYRRYFERDGVRYSHTVDPRTGSPARHPIASVTVLHEECMLADAYSTALAVLGVEEGLAFAGRQGLAALFVVRDGQAFQVRASRLFAEMLGTSEPRA
jgi:thiamine biosynthesis lipoprotein